MSKVVDDLQKTLEYLKKSNEEIQQMLRDTIANVQDSQNKQEELLSDPQKKQLIPDKKEPGEGQELLTD